jgi:hypothetical protein
MEYAGIDLVERKAKEEVLKLHENRGDIYEIIGILKDAGLLKD